MLGSKKGCPWSLRSQTCACSSSDRVLTNLQGRIAEALTLNLQLIAKKQTSLGRDHPDLAMCMNDRVDLLRSQVINIVALYTESV